MEYKCVKLQLQRQNGNCDLQEGSEFEKTEVADCSECGIERVNPINLVSSAALTKPREVCIPAGIKGDRCLAEEGKRNPC